MKEKRAKHLRTTKILIMCMNNLTFIYNSLHFYILFRYIRAVNQWPENMGLLCGNHG